jgi:putative Mg2+ transporter-C (MgtC) family protein
MNVTVNWNQEVVGAVKLLVAYLLAVPVGWHREKEAHSVGVRTFPMASVASCGYVLIGTTWAHPTIDPQSRIIQGIVAGIGFLGAGAILKSENHVHGTATAASIWNIAAVGAAVAMDRYLLAIIMAILNLITLRFLLPVKEKIGQNGDPPASPAKPGPDD